MKSVLTLAAACAVLAFAGVSEFPAIAQAQEATATDLAGRWAHPTKGTWTFNSNGTGTLVRDSVNGIPGRYTITLEWSVPSANTLSYTPIRNTLVGSPGYDKDEAIAVPKTYSAPFQILNGALVLGGAEYPRQ